MPENCCLILDTIERSERGRTGGPAHLFSWLLLFMGLLPCDFSGNSGKP
jgi:hypothetical protein